MKRFIEGVLLLLLAFMVSPDIAAAEFGEYPERAKTRLVVTPGKKLNVRDVPSTKGKLLYQLRPGDVVYVDSVYFLNQGGYEWLPVKARWGRGLPTRGYIANFSRFQEEDNPLYAPPTAEMRKIEDAVVGSQTVAKWLLLVLAVVFAAWFVYLYFKEDGKEKFLGYPDENGMRRTFFFNIRPYLSVGMVTLALVGGIVAALGSVLLIAGVVYGVLWLVKILCYVLVWVGIIGCVLSVLAIFAGEWGWIVGVIVGGLIWAYDDKIENFAESCANTGLIFFNEFNIYRYTIDLAEQYWQPVLIIALSPIVLFLALALLWLMAAGVLILVEKIMTHSYNIKHPCPHCHQSSEPARYLYFGEEIPVKLRPGVYGLLHIKVPMSDGLPTMILNGRDKLKRKCANCGRIIEADEGTECHIALVGAPRAGKSTLTYRLIAELFRRAGIKRVNFTDKENSIIDKKMMGKVRKIAANGYIDDASLPTKTPTFDRASTQVIVKRQHSPVPYRLFINDVGGELYNSENRVQGTDATRFFSDVDSILLLVDPTTTDFSDNEISESFEAWLKENADLHGGKMRMRDLQDTISNQLVHFGNPSKRIYLNIILPKIDMGYIPEDVDLTSQDALRAFMAEEMGLSDLLHWGSGFAGITIHAVGAMAKGEDAHFSSIIDDIVVRQLDIKI